MQLDRSCLLLRRSSDAMLYAKLKLHRCVKVIGTRAPGLRHTLLAARHLHADAV
jgi:hypothetical protein